jgi:hypothetical protein
METPGKSSESSVLSLGAHALLYLVKFFSPRDLLAFSFVRRDIYYLIHYSDESLDTWWEYHQLLPVSNPDSETWSLVKKRYCAQSCRDIALLQYDIDSVLDIGLRDAFNKTHNIKCKIAVDSFNSLDSFEFSFTLSNEGTEAQFLPIQHGRRHWVEWITLFIFDTDTKQCLGFYEMVKGLNDKNMRPGYVLLRAGSEMITFFAVSYTDYYEPPCYCTLLGDIRNNKKKKQSLTFVAASDYFPTIEDPFSFDECYTRSFWIRNVYEGEALIWRGGRIVSNAVVVKI